MGELIYAIDPVRSKQDDVLTIKIQEAERSGYLFNPLESQRPLTLDCLFRLATPKDTPLLAFLIKEEKNSFKKQTGKDLDEKKALFPLIRLSPRSVEEAFKLFAASGKLHFNEKPVVIDLFGKADFYYIAKGPLIEGWLKTASQTFPLTACDFIGKGPPHWFIKNMALKFISTAVSWKEFQEACQRSCRSLQELLEAAKEDEDAPKVIVEGEMHVPDPLPVLVLADRTGAFANLFLNYGEMPFVNREDPSPWIVSARGQKKCKRNFSAELGWEKDLLETDYIKKLSNSSTYYCPMDRIAKSLAFLLEIGWRVIDWRSNAVLQHKNIELSAYSDKNEIVIKGKIHYDAFQAEVSTIAGAFNRRERFLEIAPGHVALIPQSWESTGMDDALEEGEIVGDAIRIKQQRMGSLSSLLDNMRIDQGLQQLKERLTNFTGIRQATAGKSFQGVLRPYQQEGLDRLTFWYENGFHGILADDMGLGKTVQVLAFLSTLEFHQPVLIVVPTSLIFNWKREIERFLPGIHLGIYQGPQRSLGNLDHAQIILTSYTTLRLDVAALSTKEYSCLIVDEAQAIKNAHTQTFKAVSSLSSQFRLSITGTPVENNLRELWSHFYFLVPDLLGDEEAFSAEVRAGISDPRFLRRIKKRIHPFLLRRTKEEVAKDLPEKIEQTVWVAMEEEQQQLYEQFLSGIRQGILKKVEIGNAAKYRMEILEAIMRLRQICCHPLLVHSEEHFARRSAKLDALMADLETVLLENRKVLVYSQFTSMLHLIEKQVREKGWRYAYLDGSTHDRENVVNQFQEDPQIAIFLISLKAGGIGLNLTAADYVFLYDPWWNNAVENQAIDRAHRIGRKDAVIAKRYIMAESIEEKMLKLKAAKSALVEDLFGNEATLSNIGIEDLLFLLKPNLPPIG